MVDLRKLPRKGQDRAATPPEAAEAKPEEEPEEKPEAKPEAKPEVVSEDRAARTGEAELVGHWAFDDAAGTKALDSSEYGNNGTVKGDASFKAEGKIGGCLYLGHADSVEIPASDSLDLPGAFTSAMWLRSNPMGRGEHKILDRPSQLTLTVDRRGPSYSLRFRYRYARGGLYDRRFKAALPAAKWTHVAVTRDGTGSTVRIYVNGVMKDTVRPTGPAGPSTSPLVIGDGFIGNIDDLRVYNRALGAAKIDRLYRGDSGRR